jgi:hypothetical protein
VVQIHPPLVFSPSSLRRETTYSRPTLHVPPFRKNSEKEEEKEEESVVSAVELIVIVAIVVVVVQIEIVASHDGHPPGKSFPKN